jgi:hypothetical protein
LQTGKKQHILCCQKDMMIDDPSGWFINTVLSTSINSMCASKDDARTVSPVEQYVVNHSPPRSRSDKCLAITVDERMPMRTESATNQFEQTCKKQSTDVSEDEFRSKRIGIDHKTTNHASSHKQQDARGTQSSKKRSTELCNDECTSKW